MGKADVGLIGLAVMGQNLVLNMVDKGYSVAVYNRTTARTEDFVARLQTKDRVFPAYSLEEFVALLDRPRKIMLMVKAGRAVDAVIEQLLPLLSPGDVVMDGGNSYFGDTIRRGEMLKERGLLFLGTGISGGEEGALKGPSIMPGGDRTGWELLSELLLAMSAKVDGEPCCAYLGSDGVGHFVKMVHNGIEYADMQLIAEAYLLLSRLLGLSAMEISEVFSEWNRGELQSYLVEITADILTMIDEESGRPLVELILDEAGQKGTGKWTAQEALNLGIPAPTIAEAVFSRFISAQKDERVVASTCLCGPQTQASTVLTTQDISDALYAAKICAYAQGFVLLRQAAVEYNWDLDLGRVALIWRGGCIIRAQFLTHINAAYGGDLSLPNLLVDEYFRQALAQRQIQWRQVVSEAALHGIPIAGMSSALAYYDSYRSSVLPANLLQAQRDYFGAHTYRRIDREGVFHTDWSSRG
jgi:6-phosphogluconate dehydrogenase